MDSPIPCTRRRASERDRARKEAADLYDLVVDGRPRDHEAFAARIVRELAEHYNPGILEARKSVTEAGDEAAVEWEGEGSILRDVAGREWIDCLGGYGIYNLGMRHPEVVAAVVAQLGRAPLHSQELLDPLRALLAGLLARIAPAGLTRSFFCNSGAEAVEAAMKLAAWNTGRRRFVAMVNGFHGKTLGALALMGKARFRTPFAQLLGPVSFVPFGDAEALAHELDKLAHLGDLPAAVVVEPVQGEAGAIVPPDGYLPAVRDLCHRHGVLFVADEVQTCLGRTGTMFAVDHWDVVPDIMTLGKSLGGGVMPMGALMTTAELCRVWEPDPFVHSNTFGGNPLACAAAIAAIHVTLRDDLPAVAARQGERLLRDLGAIAHAHPDVLRAVRGRGLLLAMEFADNDAGYRVAAGLFRRGVLVAGTTANARAIRIEPALTIADDLLDVVVDRIATTVANVARR
jgi:putrescine aminotransferase